MKLANATVFGAPLDTEDDQSFQYNDGLYYFEDSMVVLDAQPHWQTSILQKLFLGPCCWGQQQASRTNQQQQQQQQETHQISIATRENEDIQKEVRDILNSNDDDYKNDDAHNNNDDYNNDWDFNDWEADDSSWGTKPPTTEIIIPFGLLTTEEGTTTATNHFDDCSTCSIATSLITIASDLEEHNEENHHHHHQHHCCHHEQKQHLSCAQKEPTKGVLERKTTATTVLSCSSGSPTTSTITNSNIAGLLMTTTPLTNTEYINLLNTKNKECPYLPEMNFYYQANTTRSSNI